MTSNASPVVASSAIVSLDKIHSKMPIHPRGVGGDFIQREYEIEARPSLKIETARPIKMWNL